MRGGRWILTGLLVLTIAVGGVAAALRPAEASTTAFVTDAAGRSLVAHGFSTAGSAKSSPDGLPEFTVDDLEREHADMGTNFVRFLISWRAVEPEPGVIDQGYLDAVAERVDWYAERGYHVMLDMHQDLWGWGITEDRTTGNGAPVWATHLDDLPVSPQDMWELVYLEPGVIRAFDHFWNTTGEHPELAEHYAQAWRAVAERFAGNDAVVAYDLMNEPYGGTLQGAAFESGPLTALYQRTADAIREVDADTWVCVEPQAFGFNWGLPSGLGPIDDARDGDPHIAFCPHLYPLPMDLGDGFAGDSKGLVEGTVQQWTHNVMRTAALLGDGEPVPVILGEFGLDTTHEGAEEYIRLVYETADAHGFGVAYWSRDNGSWGPYESDGTTARNLVDWLNRPYPRAVTGLQSWASSDGELTFTVGGDGGSAEVYLPPALFTAQPVVEGAEIETWDSGTGILVLRTGADARVHITAQ